MDRFVAMQAFARVVETGSFTRAADTLHLSKTSVTQLVQQLEARLRVKLLNRTTRKVNVTADGAAYYERVVRLLADLDDAETSLSSASTSPRGRLRVDVPSPFARSILIPALPTFHARYPEIQLDLGVSDRMVDLINENVDCVVRGGELTDLSLMARHIGDLQLGVYAAPSYLERAGTPSHPRELEDTHHRIVGFLWARTGKVFPYAMHRDGERVSVMGRYVLSVDDGNAYLAAGLAGLGVLWLPDYLSHAHLENGDLVPLFEDWRLEPMPLYVAFPPNRHVSLKVRVFIDWIAELMAQQAPVARRERAKPLPHPADALLSHRGVDRTGGCMSVEADFSLLESLLLARGPGGQEEEVRAVCRAELEASCDEVWVDAANNLIGVIRAANVARETAQSRAIRVMAHQDEIAMVVKRIGDDGRLHVVALGGAFPVNFGMCPVDVMGESQNLPGVLSFGTMHGTAESTQSMDILSGNVQWRDVHVITRRTKDELAQMGVRPGTRVVLSQHWRRPFRVHDAIAGHFLDDRAPVVAVLRAAEALAERKGELEQDLYFVLTTNEEETNSGAQYAARTLPGVVCIAVEVGPIAQEYGTRLCADPVILTGDEKGLYTKSVSDDLLGAAIRCGYTPQPALMPGFASDASAVLSSGSSPQAGCLAIPTENTHGYELITDGGMHACARTLIEYLLNAA